MRFALGIEYAGTDFSGWQIQRRGVTVQGTLEGALSRVADRSVQVICAGRTDAGVHATGQVVHFETEAVRTLRAYVAGCNTLLPRSVSVRWAKQVENHFHARFSALSRRYRYVICNTPMHSAVNTGRAAWYRHPLDAERMQRGADSLLGEHDFSSFRSAACESHSVHRHMQMIQVRRAGQFVLIDVQANAFLHHMVRNIVGVLLRIGAGFNSPAWAGEVLVACDRRAAAETAPAEGLYLVQVDYPPPWLFPPGGQVLLC